MKGKIKNATHAHSLYTKMRECAVKNKRKPAITFDGRRLTFLKLLKKVDSFAVGLARAGLKAGDVLTVCMKNTPAAAIALYAASRIGAAVLFVQPAIKADTLEGVMDRTKSRILFCNEAYAAKNAAAIQRPTLIISERRLAQSKYSHAKPIQPDYQRVSRFSRLLKCSKNAPPPYDFDQAAAAVLLMPSADEGKIIMHSYQSITRASNIAQGFLLQGKIQQSNNRDKSDNRDKSGAGDADKQINSLFSSLPLFESTSIGMSSQLCLTNGINIIMGAEEEIFRTAKTLEKFKPSVVMGLSSMYVRLLEDKDFVRSDLSYIASCYVCDKYAPSELIEDFSRLLKKRGSEGALYPCYGMDESAAVCAASTQTQKRSKSMGIETLRLEIIKNNRILTSGEIGEISASASVAGLNSTVKEVAGESWIYSGDYGFKDEDGYVYFVESIRHTIKVSGIPVFPSEIENLVQRISGVKRAVVVGAKDLERGEVVKLIVETQLGASHERLKKEIFDACNKHLSPYAQPRKIEFRDRLPLSPIGKIDRTKL